MVEEGRPEKPKAKRKHRLSTADGLKQATVSTPPVDEILEDEESDESDDGFDINDSSPEAAASALEQGHSKDTDQGNKGHNGKRIAELTSPNSKRKSAQAENESFNKRAFPMRTARYHSRSKSTGTALRFDVETPNRYASPHPYEYHQSTDFVLPRIVSPTGSESSTDSFQHLNLTPNGTSDDSRIPKPILSGGKIKSPKDGENLDFVKTPTATDLRPGRRGHSRVRASSVEPHHRAFAAWGQDESDASESDADI